MKLDPSAHPVRMYRAFKTKTAAYKRRATTEIPPATPAPVNPSMARRYPEREHWARAHDKELNSLEEQKVETWCYYKKDLPVEAIVIPLKMHYQYKRNQLGEIMAHKARCATRGDKMVKHKHYNSEEVSNFTNDKAIISFLLSLAANKQVKIEQYNITSAFTHERLNTKELIYVKQEPNFDVTLKQSHPYRRLDLNFKSYKLYGSVIDAFIFEGLAKQFIDSGYTRSDHDPCFFFNFDENNS